MAALSELFTLIRAEVPECSDPAMEFAVRSAARLFCRNTHCLQQTFALTTVAGTAQYTLDPGVELSILAVRGVHIDATPLLPERYELLQSIPDMEGYPHIYALSGETLYLEPTPDDVYDVTARVALLPSRSAATLSDSLVARWDEPIAAKAKSMLMTMPGKAWSNLERARLYQQQFVNGMIQAKGEVMLGADSTARVVANSGGGQRLWP